MEAREFILNFLEERGIDTAQENFESINFIENGYVDSFSIMSLLMEVESEFGYKISPEQISDSQFQTVTGLAQLIKKERP